MNTNTADSRSTTFDRRPRKDAKTMEVLGFITVVVLWAAFLGAVAFSHSSIHEAWQWFKDQSLIVQVPAGLLFLPWVIGMWIWETSWAYVWRLALVASLAWATVYAFFPWRAQ